MNNFFQMLKNNFNHRLNGEDFLNALIDEEYVAEDGETLKMCFFCEYEKFDIIEGGVDVYNYIGNRMTNMRLYYENDKKELHFLGLLCNWLNFHGVPIFAKAEDFPELSILVCKSCGRVLGVKLGFEKNENISKWYFPYCGYLDDVP